MYTLGIGGSNHDFSAALVKDGKLIVAIEDERLTRKKHGDQRWRSRPTYKSITYCLKYEGIDISKIDHIYVNSDLENLEFLGLSKVNKVNHHLAHACASYFMSPFKESCLMVADGCGEPIESNKNQHLLETISLGIAKLTNITLDTYQTGVKFLSSSNWTYRNSNSLGVFYRVVSEAIGFTNRGEGKTMGLAAYGDSSLVNEMREFVKIEKERPFEFDPYNGIYDWIDSILNNHQNSFQKRANLAFAVQSLYEEALINTAKATFKKYRSKNVCLGGGCALNCSANGKLSSHGIFENIFVFPPAGDNGLAIGAAFYGDFISRGKKRINIPQKRDLGANCYTGAVYSKSTVLNALEKTGFSFHKPKDLIEKIAQYLISQDVIAICRGRSEIGPRALGNRSILANPFEERTKDFINLLVKKRETFRPLAPIVLEEDVNEYFEFDDISPYMLQAVPVKPEYQKKLAAVTHFDGTARIQTVSKKSNAFIYDLLLQFKQLSGFGLLLNTSFNLRGEPIVESPEDAILCFSQMPINRLVLYDYLVEKHSPWSKRYLQ